MDNGPVGAHLTRVSDQVQTSEFRLEECPDLDTPPSACLVQIHPVVGRCGVQYLGKRTLIGRDQTADFCISCDSVSRHHAAIERGEDLTYRLVDLESTNGTFVNDVRVREWELDLGDTIRVGSAMVKVLPADDLEARYHEVAYQMMTHDSLTGARNRQYFEEELARELARASRHNTWVSVIILDIDHFKAVNDVHGHPAGDGLLREMVARVSASLRAECVLARLGGEEFGIVVTEASSDDAIVVAERIRSVVKSRRFRAGSAWISATVSLGVATLASGAKATLNEIVDLADKNLYEAKEFGRDRVVGSVLTEQ